ncbi:MAG TPA: hypothetical protein VN873_11990 [Candidatus Angelobacter sp.]|nr:hypothetical protein [Candidatus Angelobacter sp.]
MQFLKKNYEKIVLAVVVIAALGVVVFLPIMVSNEKQKLNDLEHSATPLPKTVAPIDLSSQDAFLQRGKTPVTLNLMDPHKIFNPYRWQLKNGKVFENPAGREVKQLMVTRISPLYEVFSFVAASVAPGLPTHYAIGIKHEAAATISGRNVKVTNVPMHQTTNNFTVIAAQGPADDPTGVTLKLSDTQKTVTISRDQPYQRVEGFTADLVYPPDNRTFLNKRKTDPAPICFAGECYKIVDIEESEVVLLQLSNQKTWIRELSPTNSTATAP